MLGEGQEKNGIITGEALRSVCPVEPRVDGRAHFGSLRGLYNRSNSRPKCLRHCCRDPSIDGDRYAKSGHRAHIAGVSHEGEDQVEPGLVSAARVEPNDAVARLPTASRPVG